MESADLAKEIVSLTNKRIGNTNFTFDGRHEYQAKMLIQATIATLLEKGLLSGCLLCKNSNQEKEEKEEK